MAKHTYDLLFETQLHIEQIKTLNDIMNMIIMNYSTKTDNPLEFADKVFCIHNSIAEETNKALSYCNDIKL